MLNSLFRRILQYLIDIGTFTYHLTDLEVGKVSAKVSAKCQLSVSIGKLVNLIVLPVSSNFIFKQNFNRRGGLEFVLGSYDNSMNKSHSMKLIPFFPFVPCPD